MWARMKSLNGFLLGDLKSGLQKAVRRHDQQLFMLVGFEFVHSKPCSLTAGWNRLKVIVEEDLGICGLRGKVESWHKMAEKARKNDDLERAIELWRQVMLVLFSVQQHRSNAWLARVYAECCQRKSNDNKNKAGEEQLFEGRVECHRIVEQMGRLQEDNKVKIKKPEDILHLAQVACDEAGKSLVYSGVETTVKDQQRGLSGWIKWWKENRATYQLPDYIFDYHTKIGRDKGRGLEHFLSEGIWLANPVPEEKKATWMKETEALALELYRSSGLRTRDLKKYVCSHEKEPKAPVGGKKAAREEKYIGEIPGQPKKKAAVEKVSEEGEIDEVLQNCLGLQGCRSKDFEWVLAQRPCGQKPPTYLAFGKGSMKDKAYWLKYDSSGSILPLKAEEQKKELGLPCLTMQRYGNYLVAPSLLAWSDIEISFSENSSHRLPVVEKGLGKNRKFQLNYKLADAGVDERRDLCEQALPLQIFATVYGYSDAQHNNYVVTNDHVYMVDHMSQVKRSDLKKNIESLRALLECSATTKEAVEQQVLRLLYGQRAPPKALGKPIIEALLRWRRNEKDRKNKVSWKEFWTRLEKQVEDHKKDQVTDLRLFLSLAAKFVCDYK
jgi:hypothetical protein